jgi:hypothetical protein
MGVAAHLTVLGYLFIAGGCAVGTYVVITRLPAP